MKKFNFTAMKRNCFLFIALFHFASTSVFAQIQYLDNSGNIKFDYSKEKAEERFKNLMQNTPLIIRGDFVSGTSPEDKTKLLPDEKPYIENNWYMVPKKVKVKAVLRGDTSLIGKVITVPFNIGLAFEGELINSSHTINYFPFNEDYEEYYFLNLDNNFNEYYNLIDKYSIGQYYNEINKYGFGGVLADEKSFFEEIIKTGNYNPKFILEAGMKIPEKEK
jgi:hypothetical protein